VICKECLTQRKKICRAVLNTIFFQTSQHMNITFSFSNITFVRNRGFLPCLRNFHGLIYYNSCIVSPSPLIFTPYEAFSYRFSLIIHLSKGLQSSLNGVATFGTFMIEYRLFVKSTFIPSLLYTLSECSFSSNLILKALTWETRFRHTDTFFLVNRIQLHQKEDKIWSTSPVTTVVCRTPVAVFFEFQSIICWTDTNFSVLTFCSVGVALPETAMVSWRRKMMWRIFVLLTEVLTLSPVYALTLKSFRLHSQGRKTSALSIFYGTKECFSVTLLTLPKNPSNLGLMKFDSISAY
jgi:hypothetical protein